MAGRRTVTIQQRTSTRTPPLHPPPTAPPTSLNRSKGHAPAPHTPQAPGNVLRHTSPVPRPSQLSPAAQHPFFDSQHHSHLASSPLSTSLEASAHACTASRCHGIVAQQEQASDQPAGHPRITSPFSGDTHELEAPEVPSPFLLSDRLLMCSRCHNAIEIREPLPNLRKRSARMWVLQCNHLLDTKCLRAIAEPPVCTSPYIHVSSILLSHPAAVGSHLPIDDSPGATSVRRRRRRLSARELLRPPEQAFDWACPVSWCQRPHTSVKTAGVWVADHICGRPSLGRLGATPIWLTV